jgi:ribonucleoside-diphosphate reductase alpha chain
METTYEERLLKERYCVDGEKDWSDICKRVANYIGNDSNQVVNFMTLMLDKDFLPNSPTLMNAGTANPMLSACFFLDVEDSIDSIFDANKNAAKIFQRGGGVGFNFSKIRPAGSKVGRRNGVASGVVSFMNVFDTMTEVVKQGGSRRGAMMGCLDITHPEIKNFITCKTTEGDLSNFNISVKLTDEFMKNPDPEIINLIVTGIWKNGEPGVLFKDTIEKYNPAPEYGELNPNPCTEALLTSGESCNLGSINLSNHIKNNAIDYDKLKSTIDSAVVFLNNVIDKNKYPIPEIDFASKRTRKIGLGIMGFHDALIKMGIPYNSQNALNIAEEVMKFINDRAHSVSESLGKNPNIKQNRMNASLTSIAPTGTISIIAGASSGIEPVFNWVYTRKDTLGEHYIVHPLFEETLKEELKRINSVHSYDGIIKHCHETGTIRDMTILSEKFRDLYSNAMDIPSSMHVKMQAAFQKNVDMSISKTINLPNSATKEEIKQIIIDAWKSGCKGLTIYRNGSRENEVLSLKKPIVEDKIVDWIETENAFYESKTPAIIYKVHSGCGKFYVIIGHDKEEPTMIFVEGDGVGGCQANMAAMGRSISAGLEWGTPAENYVKQFSKVKCMTAMNNKLSCGKSCADITGKCLGDAIKMLQPKIIKDEKKEEKCCDNPHYVMEGGCRICTNCGKSRCS